MTEAVLPQDANTKDAHAGSTGRVTAFPPSSGPDIDTRLVRFYSGYSRAAVILACAVSVVALIGDFSGLRVLASYNPAWITMMPLTAGAILLVAVGIYLRVTGADRKRGPIVKSCGAVAAVIGLSVLLEYGFGLDLRIDRIFGVPIGGPAPLYPGRASPFTAFGLVALGAGLLVQGGRRRDRIAGALNGCVLVIAMMCLSAYVLGADEVYAIASRANAIAVPTAIALFLLSSAALAGIPSQMPQAMQSARAGGVMLRQLLPVAVILPLAVDWLQLQAIAGQWLSSAQFGSAVAFVVVSAGLTFILLWSARKLDQTDAQRILGERDRATALYARSLIEASLDPLATISIDGKITDVNEAIVKVTGVPRERLLGTDFSIYFTEPEKAQVAYKQAFAEGAVTDYALTIRARDGGLTDVLYNVSAYKNRDGEVLGVFAAARDITRRKRAEEATRRAVRALRMLNVCNNLIIHATQEAKLLQDICRAIVEANGYRLAWIGYAEKDEAKSVRPMAWAGFNGDYAGTIKVTWAESDERGRGPTGAAIRTGKPVIAHNIQTDPNFAPWRAQAIAHGYHSSAAMPLASGGEIYGALMVYSVEPEAFDAGETQLLGELADDLAFAIASLRTTTALQRSEQRFRTVFESSPDCIWVWDRDHRCLYANEAAIRYVGTTREKIVDKTMAEGLGHLPDFAKLWIERVDQAIATGQSSRHEDDGPVAGRPVSSESVVSPLRNATGEIYAVTVVYRDVTERKKADRDLARAGRHARALIEASLDPLVAIDPGGKIIDVNEATVEALGVGRDTLIGSDFAGYFTAPEIAKAGYQAVFATGHVKDFPLSIRRASGEIMDVLYNASVYRDEQGKIAGVFAAARDVTERKRAEEELAKYRAGLEQIVAERTAQLGQANEKLQNANKELEEFSYSVSHDLRVPLRAVSGFSSILLEEHAGQLNDEGKRLLNIVKGGADKMARLIDDILSFSRAGRTELTQAPIDMDALVRALIAEPLASAIQGRKLVIDIGALPAARGDRAMLERVWINLIDNAIKYTLPKPEARIEIGAKAGEGETIYFVRDNGVGFDMRYADKLFGVFQRLHGDEFPGTGIGLAVVKRIVGRHGGRVWAEAKLGEGATFYFSLPNAKAAGSPA